MAHAKLYTTITLITATDMLNDRVVPFYEENELPTLLISTDRCTEYFSRVHQHNYQLYWALNDIEHAKTKVKSHRLMASVNDSIVQFYTSFVRILSER
ncbi:MAG: hypothetical protein KDC52_16015 [Ignavibacteriae bacterium]|nr:hypothetical protein [Ignavibacteriota bacterium]